jgi:AICAR transformylase/IMP cyclohydrolase PurH
MELTDRLQMDPAYVPAAIETRQVYGINMQQKRNDAKIGPSLFVDLVTQNKDVSCFQLQAIPLELMSSRSSRRRP